MREARLREADRLRDQLRFGARRWSRRDSNPRPNDRSTGFLHA